jgi:hypothetical protein
VGELIERFSDAKADGKSGSSTIAVLKKALAHVVADCRAAYGSVVLLSDGAELSFTIASVGSSEAVAAPPQVQLVSGAPLAELAGCADGVWCVIALVRRSSQAVYMPLHVQPAAGV